MRLLHAKPYFRSHLNAATHLVELLCLQQDLVFHSKTCYDLSFRNSLNMVVYFFGTCKTEAFLKNNVLDKLDEVSLSAGKYRGRSSISMESWGSREAS